MCKTHGKKYTICIHKIPGNVHIVNPLKNRSGILDTGCTSVADAKHDADCFTNTSLPSEKVFMLPDKIKIKATMQSKHNLWPL
jgi:hypothetical protein